MLPKPAISAFVAARAATNPGAGRPPLASPVLGALDASIQPERNACASVPTGVIERVRQEDKAFGEVVARFGAAVSTRNRLVAELAEAQRKLADGEFVAWLVLEPDLGARITHLADLMRPGGGIDRANSDIGKLEGEVLEAKRRRSSAIAGEPALQGVNVFECLDPRPAGTRERSPGARHPVEAQHPAR